MRDSQRHATGRRHGAREMTSDSGQPLVSNDVTVMAQNAYQSKRDRQEKNMQSGPSFMDQMYKGDEGRNSKQVTGAGRGTANKPDSLNVFSWDMGKGGQRQRDGEQLQGPIGRSDAEARRTGESKKFEDNKNGNFLKFSENPSKPARQPISPQNQCAPYATNYEANPKAEAMRGGRRQPPANGGKAGPEIDGFPGMGQNSRHKPFQHIPRKNVESNVFLPEPPGMAEERFAPPQQQQRAPPNNGGGLAGMMGMPPPPRGGAYTTSNGTYGVETPSEASSPSGAYQPPDLSNYPPRMAPPQHAGQPPSAYANPNQGYYREEPSESSTPRYLRDERDYEADDRELYEYEEQLRMRLQQARGGAGGGCEGAGCCQQRGNATAYDYSTEDGFSETPREELEKRRLYQLQQEGGGAARWIDDESAVTPSSVTPQATADRRVRFDM